MKRLLSLALVLSLVLVLTSCLEIEKKRDPKEMLNVVEPLNMGERTIDISDGIATDKYSFAYSCDLDYDGENEDISMNVIFENDYAAAMDIIAGDKKVQVALNDGVIEKVYSCDIVENDRTRDIVIITTEGSGDPEIKILSYKNDLQAYDFVYKNHENEERKVSSHYLGYATSFYFKVNEEGAITVEEQTDSYGMWSVNKKYKLKDGAFEEIPYVGYVILPDFMQKRTFFYENVTEEEKEKWKNGYIKAYIPYSNESISIAEGEYIKPTHDDGKNTITVEKENGEIGYINVGLDSDFERYAFNEMFFYLAG